MMRVLTLVALMTTPTLVQAQMRPGEWQLTARITSLEKSNASPEQAEEYKKGQPRPEIRRLCVTPEQAALGPVGLVRDSLGPGCRITRHNTSDGKFEMATACDTNGVRATGNMTGTFSDTKFNVETVIDGEGTYRAKIRIATTGERIGDCK